VALTEYEKLWNQNIQRNNEKLESLNLSSMPLKTPTFKNPKQKTPKGTEAIMKMALWKLKAIAPHQ
jgi:antitoxin component HigA of HigAB toxin-antitoxin module